MNEKELADLVSLIGKKISEMTHKYVDQGRIRYAKDYSRDSIIRSCIEIRSAANLLVKELQK